jgi:hypothetical protein
MRSNPIAAVLACLVLIVSAVAARAQNSEELAKKLNNPIGDLVSVPFQFNWEFGNGPDEDVHHVLNLQPVVPFAISEHTNMIARLIMPTISTPGGTVAGDMVFSLFFSPSMSTGTIWGAGPVLQLPRTGEKWGIGPTFVILKQQGRHTYGVLANHLWSFAGDESAPDLNQTFLQPFFAVTNRHAITYTIQSESTANWEAADGNEWTIPLNFQIAKMAKFGTFPASYAAGGGVYLDSPSGGPEWKLRAVITILIPAR